MRFRPGLLLAAVLGPMLVLSVLTSAEAQQAAKVPRVGLLLTTHASDPLALRLTEAFREGLRERGYVDGQNIVLEYRWADGNLNRSPRLAADLVRRKVDVIVVGAT
jgi:putative ABC transport system substrate-binding protein